MNEKNMKKIENYRSMREEGARRASHRRGKRFAWRVLNLVMVVTMLLNSVSFASPSLAQTTLVRAETYVGTDFVDSHVGEQEAELDESPTLDDGTLPGNTYVYAFEEKKTVLLSEIFARYMLPIDVRNVETVMFPGGDALVEPTEQLYVEPLMDEDLQIYDYEITALQAFEEARLSVNLKDDVYTLVLVNLPAEIQGADLPKTYAEGEDDEVYEPYETDLDADEGSDEGEAPLNYLFSLGGSAQARLSEIIAACGMPIGLEEIEMVGQPGGAETADAPVSVEKDGSDYVITAMEAFDEVRLAVYTADDTCVVVLMDGVPAEDEEEATSGDVTDASEAIGDDARGAADEGNPSVEADIEEESEPEVEELPDDWVEEQTEVYLDENTTTNGQTEVGFEENVTNGTDTPDEGVDESREESPEEVPEARDPSRIDLDGAAEYAGEYLGIAPVGAGVALRAIEIEAADYMRVEEAYIFESGEGVEVELDRAPELAEGEYLALYGIREDGLSDAPVADHWIEGDGAAVSARAWAGFALVRLGLTDYQQLPAESVGEAVIEVSGTLPVNGSVSLERVDALEHEDDVVASCDIRIVDAADNDFEPLEGQPIEITVRSEGIRAANEAGSALSVVQVADGFETDAGVEIVGVEGDAVTFTADSCDAFAVREIVLDQERTASDQRTYRITVAYDTASGIPADAELVVEEITAADEAYAEYVRASVDSLDGAPKNVRFAKAFDIALRSASTGEICRPTEDVRVTVELLDDSLDDYENLDVVHIHDEGETRVEAVDATVNGETVAFAIDGFSVIVVLASDDAPSCRIPAGQAVRLSEILEKLGDAGVKLEDVVSASSSNEERMKVAKIEGAQDWEVTCPTAFTEEKETLTLTLENGTSFQILIRADRAYTVTWLDEDGDLLKTTTVFEGDAPDYGEAPPTKADSADGQYSYTFAGWTYQDGDKTETLGTHEVITGDTEYTASYRTITRTYEVTWANWDGAVLKTDEIEYGKTATYDGEDPTRPNSDDGQFTYTFAGWTYKKDGRTLKKDDDDNVTEDITYIASYTEKLRTYTIEWRNANDALIGEPETYEYGETPKYSGEDPVYPYESDTHEFSHWEPQIMPVTGDAVYRAAYTTAAMELYLHESGKDNVAIAGVTFALKNKETGKVVWQGKTNEYGLAQIELRTTEQEVTGDTSSDQMGATFSVGSTYILTQLSKANGYVQPKGYWTITVNAPDKKPKYDVRREKDANDYTTLDSTGSHGISVEFANAVSAKLYFNYNFPEDATDTIPAKGTSDADPAPVELEKLDYHYEYTIDMRNPTAKVVDGDETYEYEFVGWQKQGSSSLEAYGDGQTIVLDTVGVKAHYLKAGWRIPLNVEARTYSGGKRENAVAVENGAAVFQTEEVARNYLNLAEFSEKFASQNPAVKALDDGHTFICAYIERGGEEFRVSAMQYDQTAHAWKYREPGDGTGTWKPIQHGDRLVLYYADNAVRVKWVRDDALTPLHGDFPDQTLTVGTDAWTTEADVFDLINTTAAEAIVEKDCYFLYFGFATSDGISSVGGLKLGAADDIQSFGLKNTENGFVFRRGSAGTTEDLKELKTIYLVYSETPPAKSARLNLENYTDYIYAVRSLTANGEDVIAGGKAILEGSDRLYIYDGNTSAGDKHAATTVGANGGVASLVLLGCEKAPFVMNGGFNGSDYLDSTYRVGLSIASDAERTISHTVISQRAVVNNQYVDQLTDTSGATRGTLDPETGRVTVAFDQTLTSFTLEKTWEPPYSNDLSASFTLYETVADGLPEIIAKQNEKNAEQMLEYMWKEKGLSTWKLTGTAFPVEVNAAGNWKAEVVYLPARHVYYAMEDGIWQNKASVSDFAPVYKPAADGHGTAVYNKRVKVICRVGSEEFTNLKDAVKYIVDSLSGKGTIEMLCDYTVSESNAVTIPESAEITLTTAEGVERATLTRGYDGAALFTVQGKGALTVTDVVLDGKLDKTQYTGVNGGLVAVEKDGQFTAGKGAVLQNGSATENGGAVYGAEGSAIIIGEDANITACTAILNGGAVYGDAKSKITVSGNATITGNTAKQSGGAIYGAEGSAIDIGGSASITANTASQSGGAVCGGASSTIAIAGVAGITGNRAYTSGSAIFVENGAENALSTIKLQGGRIEDNLVTGGRNGAIVVGGVDCVIELSGSPVVQKNGYNGDNSESRWNYNLCLNQDSYEIIHVVGSGLDESATVRVYVPDNLYYNRYGKPARPFAIFDKGAGENLDRIISDRIHSDENYGCQTTVEVNGSKNVVVWGKTFSFKVKAVWMDENYNVKADSEAPADASVRFTLVLGEHSSATLDSETAQVSVDANGGWMWTFSGLARYDENGDPCEYGVKQNQLVNASDYKQIRFVGDKGSCGVGKDDVYPPIPVYYTTATGDTQVVHLYNHYRYTSFTVVNNVLNTGNDTLTSKYDLYRIEKAEGVSGPYDLPLGLRQDTASGSDWDVWSHAAEKADDYTYAPSGVGRFFTVDGGHDWYYQLETVTGADMKQGAEKNVESGALVAFHRYYNIDFGASEPTGDDLVAGDVVHDAQGKYRLWTGTAWVDLAFDTNKPEQRIVYTRQDGNGGWEAVGGKPTDYLGVEVGHNDTYTFGLEHSQKLDSDYYYYAVETHGQESIRGWSLEAVPGLVAVYDPQYNYIMAENKVIVTNTRRYGVAVYKDWPDEADKKQCVFEVYKVTGDKITLDSLSDYEIFKALELGTYAQLGLTVTAVRDKNFSLREEKPNTGSWVHVIDPKDSPDKVEALYFVKETTVGGKAVGPAETRKFDDTSFKAGAGTQVVYSYRQAGNIIYVENLSDMLCKIVDDDGSQHPFRTLNQALTYGRTERNGSHTEFTIQMLRDYTIPASDQMKIAAGEKITLTTAEVNDSEYPYTGKGTRAVITRQAGNNNSFIRLEGNDNTQTSMTLVNIEFDGGDAKIGTSGGFVYAQRADVLLLSKDNSFETGVKMTGGSANGQGGAVWCSGDKLYAEYAEFDKCIATTNGGALAGDKSGKGKTEVYHCQFTNCTSGMGGAVYSNHLEMVVEGDARTRMQFANCTATGSKGGAICHNCTVDNSVLTVRYCDFDKCSRTGTSAGNGDGGGAIGAASRDMLVEWCDFTDCSTVCRGGGVLHYNDHKGTSTVRQCVFTRDTATSQGGGGSALCGLVVYVDDCKYIECNSESNGGGIDVGHFNVDKTVFITGCEFVRCVSNTGSGGAISVGGLLTVNKCKFDSCFAKSNGGAIALHLSTSDLLELYGCEFNGCYSTNGQGGAVYSLARKCVIDNYTEDGANTNTSFRDCYTNSNNGGAVYSTGYYMEIGLNGGTTLFENCYTNSNYGGAVHVANNTNNATIQSAVTAKHVTFDGCYAVYSGGALYSTAVRMTVEDGTFDNCRVKRPANDNYGGAIRVENNGAGSNTTLLGVTFEDCMAWTDNHNGYGGAVYTISRTVLLDDYVDAEGNVRHPVIKNCKAAHSGGAIYVNNNANTADEKSSLTIRHAEVSNCESYYYAGAVYTATLLTTVEDSTFTNCETYRNDNNDAYGGALRVSNDTLGSTVTLRGDYFENCVARNNTSNAHGGAVYVNARNLYVGNYEDADGKVAHTAFKDCTSTADGGAIKQNNAIASTLTVEDAVFTDCKGNNNGGGIWSSAAVASVTNTTFEYTGDDGAVRANHGGGFFHDPGNQGSLTVTGCTFDNLAAKAYGGGLRTNALNVYLRNNAFTDCVCGTTGARGEGGGVNCASSTLGSQVFIEGCTFENCKAQSRSDCNGGGASVYARNLTVGDYTVDGATIPTTFTDCDSMASGGGLFHDNTTQSEVWVSNVAFTNCTAVNGGGGGMSTTAIRTTLENCVFERCTVTSDANNRYANGGGLRISNSNAGTSATVRNTQFNYCRTVSYTAGQANGGAIYASCRRLTVVGNDDDITFDHCSTAGHGGAIRHDNGNADTVLSVSNAKFNYCYSTYNGGAVSTSAYKQVFELCDFDHCIATTTKTNSSSGGAIYADKSAADTSTTVRGCAFTGCEAKSNSNSHGGTIYTSAWVLTVEGAKDASGNTVKTQIKDSTSWGRGGAIYQTSGGTETSVSLTDCALENCKALVKNGANYAGESGGGLYTFARTVRLKRCTMDDCASLWTGGAIYQNYSYNDGGDAVKDYTSYKYASSLTIEGEAHENRFTDCRTIATDRDSAGGAISTNAVTLEINGTDFQNCYTLRSHGGAIYHSNGNTNLDAGAVIKNSRFEDCYCAANANGGAIYEYGKKLDIADTVINGNTGDEKRTNASNGGGIYSFQAEVNLTHSEILNCVAASNGGGLYHTSWTSGSYIGIRPVTLDDTRVEGNIAGNQGGGVFFTANETLTLRKGTIVTGNRITRTNVDYGAGIYLVNNPKCVLVVGYEPETGSGNSTDTVTVYDNWAAGPVRSDVRLNFVAPNDRFDSVLLLSDLKGGKGENEGVIGVCNPGQKLSQFGISSPANHDGAGAFVSDDGTMEGRIDSVNTENIIWYKPPVCKITNGANEDPTPLYFEDGKGNRIQMVFDNLRDAIEYCNREITDNGYFVNPQTGERLEMDKLDLQIQMLKSRYSLTDYDGDLPAFTRSVTLTTAPTGSEDTDYHWDQEAVIMRDATSSPNTKGSFRSMFKVKGEGVTLTVGGIILDGGAGEDVQEKCVARSDGGIIEASAGAEVVLRKGMDAFTTTTLRNSVTTGNGGAICLKSGARLTVQNESTIQNCSALNGGGVYVGSSCDMQMMHYATIDHCSAEEHGGAIYVSGNASVSMDGTRGNKNEITNNSITGTSAASNGAGIYLYADDSRLEMKGTLYFDNNVSPKFAAAKENGAELYETPRQDIYLSSDAESAKSIVLAGDITNGEGDDGFIWVWAESNLHFKKDQQFATIKNGVEVQNYTLNAFRDAQADETTENIYDDYYTGVRDEDPQYVNWGINLVDFKFMKVSGASGLAGAEFTVYPNTGSGNLANDLATPLKTRTSEGVIVVSQFEHEDEEGNIVKEGTVDVDGVLRAGRSYYMKETGVPTSTGLGEEATYVKNNNIYRVTIAENGKTVTMGVSKGDETFERYTEKLDGMFVIRNTKAICKVIDAQGGETPFETLNAAVAFIRGNAKAYIDGVATIQMLVDYTVPRSDRILLRPGDNTIALTTASKEAKNGEQYTYVGDNDQAVLRRGSDYDDGSMIGVDPRGTGEGAISFALYGITLDGMERSADASLIHAEKNMQLTVGEGAVIQRAYTSGSGAAVQIDASAGLRVQGARFYDCRAERSGGAISAANANVAISDADFESCGAGQNGGAVYHQNKDGELTIAGTRFESCSAGINGGAVYTDALTLNVLGIEGEAAKRGTFEKCNADKGGAIYHGVPGNITGSALNIKDCDVKECTAVSAGGGIYGTAQQAVLEDATVTGYDDYGVKLLSTQGDGGALYMTGWIEKLDLKDTVISGCDVQGSGGAIYTASDKLKITLEKTTITDCVSESSDIERDGGGAIFHTYEGSAIFRTQNKEDKYAGTRFEIAGDGESLIDKCIANANGGGMDISAAEIAMTGVNVSNCDANGSDPQRVEICGGGGAFLRKVETAQVTDCTFADCKTAQSEGGGICVAQDSMDANQKLTITGSTFTGCLAQWLIGKGGGVYVKNMALDVVGTEFNACKALYGGGIYNDHGAVTLKNIPAEGETDEIVTRFISCYNNTNGGGIATSGGTVDAEGTLFDTCTGNQGSGINADADAQVTLKGVKMIACSTSNTGGGIYLNNSKLTLDDLEDETAEAGYIPTEMRGCKSTNNSWYGGAMYLTNSAEATIGGHTLITLKTDDDVEPDAVRSGAIYVGSRCVLHFGADDDDNPTLRDYKLVKNGSSDNTGNGAGIYVYHESTTAYGVVTLMGSPVFENNLSVAMYTGTIGTSNAPYDNDSVRQDIYVDMRDRNSGQTVEKSQSIVLEGDLHDPGRQTYAREIWVFETPVKDAADQKTHYRLGEQFAVIADGVEVSDDTLAVFRNACMDSVTGNDGETGLCGVRGEAADCVYWGLGILDSVNVAFKKIDGFGEALGGATFALYTDASGSTPALDKENKAITATSFVEAYTDSETGKTYLVGDVLFAELTSGIYYMKETAAPAHHALDGNIYLVLAGDSAVEEAKREGGALNGVEGLADYQLPEAEEGETPFAIFLLKEGKVVAGSDAGILEYGIMNASSGSRKVILKKTDEGYAPLPGAKFTVYHADKQTVVTVDGVAQENLTSGNGGAFFIGTLPFGLYYIKETEAPAGYYQPKYRSDEAPDIEEEYFAFRVTENGVEQAQKDSDGKYPTTNELAIGAKGDSGSGSGASGGNEGEKKSSTSGKWTATISPPKSVYKKGETIQFDLTDGTISASTKDYGWAFSVRASGGDVTFYTNNNGTTLNSAGTIRLTLTIEQTVWGIFTEEDQGRSFTFEIKVEDDSGTGDGSGDNQGSTPTGEGEITCILGSVTNTWVESGRTVVEYRPVFKNDSDEIFKSGSNAIAVIDYPGLVGVKAVSNINYTINGTKLTLSPTLWNDLNPGGTTTGYDLQLYINP